jgi:hypothetical protein
MRVADVRAHHRAHVFLAAVVPDGYLAVVGQPAETNVVLQDA